MSEKRDLIDAVPTMFSELHATDNIFWSPSVAGELQVGPPELLEALTAIGALSGLVHAASRSAQVANRALSWRNYRVGSTVIMVNFATGMMGYLDGWNVKPESGLSVINIHAEQMGLAKGRRQQLDRAIGISLFADPTDADANPLGRPTLLPCMRCLDMFIEAPEVTEHTLVLGTNPDFSTCQLYTVGSIFSDEPWLIPEPFSLITENDLDYFDRALQPHAIPKIFETHKTA